MARTGGKTTYTREDVIELLAAIYAAGHLFIAEDVKLSTELRQEEVSHLVSELEAKFLGRIDYGDQEDSDEPWETDPDDLAIRIREAELEAQMIDAGYARKIRSAELTAEFQARDGRPARLRLFADRLREAGTQKDVYFPGEREIAELVRGGRDAS